MYVHEESWRALQQLLPERSRFKAGEEPAEQMVRIGRYQIHLDIYDRPSDTAIVILHGVGGNGRLLSFIAAPLARAGYRVVCPDLPGYGFSEGDRHTVYADWIAAAGELVERELSHERRVYLFGLSAGGMLAYQCAALHPGISGLIATNLLDNRDPAVRERSARWSLLGRYGMPLAGLLPEAFQRRIQLPVRSVTRMNALVNRKEMLTILLNDSKGAGSSVSLRFLYTMLASTLAVEPEEFRAIPVLLAHPGEDRWTPQEVSERFFRRISAEKLLVTLEGAGHFPVEYPGIRQLEDAVLAFIGE